MSFKKSRERPEPPQAIKSVVVVIFDASDKAWLVSTQNGKKWIPKAAVREMHPEAWAFGETVTIKVPAWLVRKQGL